LKVALPERTVYTGGFYRRDAGGNNHIAAFKVEMHFIVKTLGRVLNRRLGNEDGI
jgi:hypothetical protein